MMFAKKYLLGLMMLVPAVSFAQPNASVVHWDSIVGVITAPGTDNPVAGISAGAGPWSVTRGKAKIDLANGSAFFEVDGLVMVGGNATGTPGGVVNVAGTFICNPGTPTQVVKDTPAVGLNPTGDAFFVGTLGGMPPTCANPLFLIRVVPATGGPTKWIATGAIRSEGGGN